MAEIETASRDINSSESIMNLGSYIDTNTLVKRLQDFTPESLHPLFVSLSEIVFFGIDLLHLFLATFVLLIVLTLRSFITFVANSGVKYILRGTNQLYQEAVISNLYKPIRFGILLIGLYLFFTIIFGERGWIDILFSTLFVGNLFWLLVAIVVASKDILHKTVERVNPDFSNEISGFMLKVLISLVVIAGILAILQLWGVNVATLVASLGIGGLAVALAAKDTVANIFGSLALLFDKSVRIGEWVKVQDVEGTIEELGMRTTKIRTFDKALISIPNQVIANEFIENFGRRNIRRVRMIIGLTYSTTPDQIQSIRDAIEELLVNHDDVSKEPWVIVRFESFGASSLDIRIDYYLIHKIGLVPYLEVVESINLSIMEIVNANNASFAFPSQSLYIEQMPPIALQATPQE
ncbi:MAG TPA: mechanosensitive ion channel family protein [Epsilonproteobacteria bacterium]|nr:mechanosensitive ion channel family protein [Campylobacterota bacterium]